MRNGLAHPRSCEQLNYLDECDRAHARGAVGAATVKEGIRAVLDGCTDNFSYSYQCHSPTERQWFRLIVAPFCPDPKTRWAVLLHVNTTHQRYLAMRYSRINKGRADFVSVCAWCKLIKNKPGDWITFEEYFSKGLGVQFSHGICSKCVNAFLENPIL
jgi:hypothetical protein